MKSDLIPIFVILGFALCQEAEGDSEIPTGVARVDITPRSPVQLINVKEPTESLGVSKRLFARALVLGRETDRVVLISFDGIGVPRTLAKEVSGRLEKSHQLKPEQIAICASHTHWAPHLAGILGNIYGGALPVDHQQRVDSYSRFLADQLEKVAVEALANQVACHLEWNAGRVGFAANRRLEEGGQLLRDEEKGLMITWNPNAPVDHDLPVLIARDAESGKLRALHFSYACHNVALTGSQISGFENRIHGDWVGLTQEEIEKRHPDCIAICTIGCGGDQRPDFCGNESVALAHAVEIANEIDRLLEQKGNPVEIPITASRIEAVLPLSPLPSLDQLEGYADPKLKTPSIIARAAVAKQRVDEINSGRETPRGVPFSSQAWRFSKGPSLVFLTGEVCVDFQIQIKETHGETTWPVAYANATPCYIVSRRMLEAGGYEASTSMYYYGWLRTLLPEAENLVLETVSRSIDAATALLPTRGDVR